MVSSVCFDQHWPGPVVPKCSVHAAEDSFPAQSRHMRSISGNSWGGQQPMSARHSRQSSLDFAAQPGSARTLRTGLDSLEPGGSTVCTSFVACSSGHARITLRHVDPTAAAYYMLLPAPRRLCHHCCLLQGCQVLDQHATPACAGTPVGPGVCCTHAIP